MGRFLDVLDLKLKAPAACITPAWVPAEIEADASAWQGVRDDVIAGDVVDFRREMLVA
ncbi:MAG: hypothetical protein M3Y55_01810 [Pseudomonadota bacterium]|nr:hypothetical protein [Pseudomonadota bacterium]